MATDFDVVVIGSGFGGAISACRLAEAGYKVLILERGRHWEVEDCPRRYCLPSYSEMESALKICILQQQ